MTINTITIIGLGPRGMSVLERLVARLNNNQQTEELNIIVVDDRCIGQGRIWDSSQSKSYIMNTLSTEVSAFSGPGSIEGAIPGCGPSFAEWWKSEYSDFDDYQGFAPRKYYGEYLYFVYKTISSNLPKNVQLIEYKDTIIDIEKQNDSYLVVSKQHGSWINKAVVITTGHSTNQYQGYFKKLEDFAKTNSKVKFYASNSANEMDLTSICPQEKVGVIGIGLSFFDIIAELTEGRGGKYIESDNNQIIYSPSGQEPVLYCGSRSGLPILARGRNQKPADYKYSGIIFTNKKVADLRQKMADNLDFNYDVWPLLEAEVNLNYFRQLIFNQLGQIAANQFITMIQEQQVEDSVSLASIASEILSKKIIPLDLKQLARPFDGQIFNSFEEWEKNLIDLLLFDLSEAIDGNVNSPLKSALDVLRFSRDSLRVAIDFGGLTPDSHQSFLHDYVPIITLLSAGPPLFRIKQLIALIKAGIVSIVPPKAKFDIGENCYILSSDVLKQYEQIVTTLIDARVPIANLQQDKNPLTIKLYERGIYSPFVNRDKAGNTFETGGVNVTPSPFNPIGADGTIHNHLFVLGIPTEHVRWFMQSGSSRPSHWIDFMIDADSIAQAVLFICAKNK